MPHQHPPSPWLWLVLLGVYAPLLVLRPLGRGGAADGDGALDDADCSESYARLLDGGEAMGA